MAVKPRPAPVSRARSTTRRHKPSESFADWMARVDAEVDDMARKIERKPPDYAWLHPAQRRIVQMLIEHLRSLPELDPGEDACEKPEYLHVNLILGELFKAKYPNWTQRRAGPGSGLNIRFLPNGDGQTFAWIMRNCAGRAPAERIISDVHDED